MRFPCYKKFVFSFLAVFLFFPLLAAAADDYGAADLGSRLGYKTYNVDQDILLAAIANVISIVLGVLGVVFLVMMIYFGARWMTAGGDTKAVQTAKDGIFSLVIGLIIILSAYAITSFVLKFFNPS